jgi:hypothetical protein
MGIPEVVLWVAVGAAIISASFFVSLIFKLLDWASLV